MNWKSVHVPWGLVDGLLRESQFRYRMLALLRHSSIWRVPNNYRPDAAWEEARIDVRMGRTPRFCIPRRTNRRLHHAVREFTPGCCKTWWWRISRTWFQCRGIWSVTSPTYWKRVTTDHWFLVLAGSSSAHCGGWCTVSHFRFRSKATSALESAVRFEPKSQILTGARYCWMPLRTIGRRSALNIFFKSSTKQAPYTAGRWCLAGGCSDGSRQYCNFDRR